jgi:hypothetical protein
MKIPGQISVQINTQCADYSLIQLKGQVYRTCSYLAFRYRAGEVLFMGGLVVGMIAHWLSQRKAQRIPPPDIDPG